MNTKLARRLAQWLALPAALFALSCALLAPAEAGGARPGATPRRARQERRQREPESNSTVRGRVVYDDTRRPVRRGHVILVGESGTRTEHSALTDARGEFHIRKVQAGRYFAFVDVPGALSPLAFLSLSELRGPEYGGVPDLGEGRAFFDPIVVDGKEDLDVTVRVYRGAALAGRVTYADGDPAVNVVVSLMRRDADGRLQRFVAGSNLASLSGLKTDDRGMYRLTGLPPGEYVVAVSESVDHSPDGLRAHTDDMPGIMQAMLGQQLVMSFHPSGTSAKEAAVVKVAAGEERADVDVRIPDRELHTLSGVVRSRRGGRPLAGARVFIARRDELSNNPRLIALYDMMESALNRTTTGEDGRWQFTEIPDGQYTITVKPAEGDDSGAPRNMNMNINMNMNMSMNAPADDRELPVGDTNASPPRPHRRRRAYAPTRRDVDVSGGDLSEVLIEVGDGGRVSGTFAVDRGEPLQYAHIGLLRATGGGEADVTDYTRGAEVYADRFSIEGLTAGRFFLHANVYEEGGALYVKSITWNGKDLLREPLELAEGAEVEGVRIVFGRDPAKLRLTAVTAGDRKPAPHTNLFILPAEVSDWQPNSARNLFCTTGNDGSCPMLVPPGEYRVVALPPQGVSRHAYEAEVRRRASAAPRLSLRGGETKELEVVVHDR